MLDHQVQNWQVRKPPVRSRGGIVATQSRIAGDVGARVLAAGGNAVDAAVATGFALAAVEPWNSGLGGIGFLLVYLAEENQVRVVDFGPVAPRGLDPSAYPLVGGDAVSRDLFTWPMVKEDRNIHGPLSFTVPGQVDGLGLALQRFGTLELGDVLRPAIELASQGIAVDWFLTLRVATMAGDLARFPTTREVWLPNGFPPATAPGAPLARLHLKGLTGTLERLAQVGRRDFYEGDIAAAIVEDVRALGGVISAEDLAGYRARVVEPITTDYRGTQIAAGPHLTAGPSLLFVLDRLRHLQFEEGGPHADAFVAYAAALREAHAERTTTMGDTADARDPSSTTHLDVVDRHGNMASLTQTLLSVFGSKIVLDGTGILMNNGVMWFDPRPGSPNQLGPGKRPLTNMCPVIASRGGTAWFAIGASGGRKILPAVAQISSFLIDHGMTLEQAFHQPRIDAGDGETVTVDPRLPAPIREALAAALPTRLAESMVYPANYACPSAVLRDPASGEHVGITDVGSPWSAAVAEDELA